MGSSRIENIFKLYSKDLKAFISRRISSNSESEDVLHDVFYRFIITDGEDEVIENAMGWLYRVARNLITDRSRKRREVEMPYTQKSEDNELVSIPFSAFLSEEGSDPETEVVYSIIREELLSKLSELPAEQRAVFELHEMQGVSFKEISEATNTPINTLISRKRYATLYLRKELAQIYDEIKV